MNSITVLGNIYNTARTHINVSYDVTYPDGTSSLPKQTTDYQINFDSGNSDHMGFDGELKRDDVIYVELWGGAPDNKINISRKRIDIINSTLNIVDFVYDSTHYIMNQVGIDSIVGKRYGLLNTTDTNKDVLGYRYYIYYNAEHVSESEDDGVDDFKLVKVINKETDTLNVYFKRDGMFKIGVEAISNDLEISNMEYIYIDIVNEEDDGSYNYVEWE